MSPYIKDLSSPLSSAQSMSTPPGAWVDDKPVPAPAALSGSVTEKGAAATPESIFGRPDSKASTPFAKFRSASRFGSFSKTDWPATKSTAVKDGAPASSGATTTRATHSSGVEKASTTRSTCSTTAAAATKTGSADPASSSSGAVNAAPSATTEKASTPKVDTPTMARIKAKAKAHKKRAAVSPSGSNKSSGSGKSTKSTSSAGSKKRAHSEIEPEVDPALETLTDKYKRTKAANPTNLPPIGPLSAGRTMMPPPVGTRSSGRTRKAPSNFANFAATPPAAPRKSLVYDPVYMTTNSNSRLKKTDLFHLLLLPGAWTSLSAAEKLRVLALLPASPVNVQLAAALGAGTAAPNTRPREFDINFNLFRTDVAKFKEDLENGHLAKTWLAGAEVAMKERAEGKFDEWKEDEAEAWWGQK